MNDNGITAAGARRLVASVLLGLAVLAVAGAPRSRLTAGGGKADEKTPLPPDLRLVPADGVFFATFRPADLLGAPLTEKALAGFGGERPGEVGRLEKQIGMSLAGAERLTIVVPTVDSEPVVVCRTTKPYDRDRLIKRAAPDARAETRGGKTLHVSAKSRSALHFVDKRVFVLGPPEAVGVLLGAAKDGGKGPLAAAVTLAAGKHFVVAAARPGEVLRALAPRPYRIMKRTDPSPRPGKGDAGKDDRDKERREERKDGPKEKPKEEIEDELCSAIQEKEQPEPPPQNPPRRREFARPPAPSLEKALEQLPPEGLIAKPVFLARSVTATLDVGATTRATLRLAYAGEDQARDGVTSVRVGLYVLRELLPRALREAGLSLDESAAARGVVKAVETALRSAAVERRGTSVRASVQVKLDPAAVAGLTEAMRAAGQWQRSANKLKQIGLAFYNFNDSLGGMPANAIYSKDGKPLLSWRVAILPYIEEERLFGEFKFDEPWDSPHNKKLLARMPKVYAPVAGKTKVPYSTYYQVFTGAHTPFNPAAVRSTGGPRPLSLGGRIPASFPDGLSNTILAVEAGEAVPWTKPDDLPYDPKKPLPKLGGIFPDGFHVLFADGLVRLLRKDFDESTMRNLIDPADGNVVDFSKVLPRSRPRR
jgi:hypothetical protein